MIPEVVMVVLITAVTELLKSKYFAGKPGKVHATAFILALVAVSGWEVFTRTVDPMFVERVLGIFASSIALYEVFVKRVLKPTE